MSLNGVDISIDNLNRDLVGCKIFLVFELEYMKIIKETQKGYFNFKIKGKILVKKPEDNVEDLASQIGF